MKVDDRAGQAGGRPRARSRSHDLCPSLQWLASLVSGFARRNNSGDGGADDEGDWDQDARYVKLDAPIALGKSLSLQRGGGVQIQSYAAARSIWYVCW